MPLDQASFHATHGEHPVARAEEITPADSNLDEFTRSLYIGTSGNVAVIMAEEHLEGGTTVITYKNVPAGTILPYRVSQVRSTGTTAADIVALF